MQNKINMVQTNVDRRSFIKKMAAAAAMTAAATMFPGIVFAAEQLENVGFKFEKAANIKTLHSTKSNLILVHIL